MAAGITFEIASARLTLYLTAEAKVLGSQAYKIGDREMTRAELKEIREGISYWSGLVDQLNPLQRQLPAARAVGRMRPGAYRLR